MTVVETVGDQPDIRDSWSGLWPPPLPTGTPALPCAWPRVRTCRSWSTAQGDTSGGVRSGWSIRNPPSGCGVRRDLRGMVATGSPVTRPSPTSGPTTTSPVADGSPGVREPWPGWASTWVCPLFAESTANRPFPAPLLPGSPRGLAGLRDRLQRTAGRVFPACGRGGNHPLIAGG